MYKGNINQFLDEVILYMKKTYDMEFMRGKKAVDIKNNELIFAETFGYFMDEKKTDLISMRITDDEDIDEQVYAFINRELQYRK